MRRTRTYGITVALAIAVVLGLAVLLLTGVVDGATAVGVTLIVPMCPLGLSVNLYAAAAYSVS